ncbi:nucleoporin Nup120/160-domain-containing protein [Microdochium trichocladiopsis]|uniref:Nucleoporin Nup120/160-domain-containing protein n=1 Tax=Microdochium trichocladiopsis TaxID=1682393 RepID=A0A9P9BQT9_9PEZI|nr:nucleoporin Nup120/160-domain-containing protein [Microdochium trichocladiopsis]KAH7031190.1 nucleoporin Nup120/160-domain-containing protein [Microdochium trichocladiopsis]
MAPKVDFIEVQLNLEPPSAAYVVDLKLPTTVAPGKAARRTRPQSHPSNGSHLGGDEFRRARTCATTSSIFRRSETSTGNDNSDKQHQQQKKYPRSLLWRLVEEDTVLSIRSADIVKPNSAQPANLVLNFEFQHAVRPACIAFHESTEHDAVHLFVLDTANQLYNIVLKADSFRKRSVAESSVSEWCRVHVPNALNNFKQPYRLTAVNDDQLITTLADGGLIRLDRNKSGGIHGPWKETFYNAKGWAHSFRTILSRGGDMDASAAAAAVQTDFGFDDASFLFTVCLDHRLRIWNLNSGQVASACDLLNAERSPQETGKWQLDPAQTNLLRLVGDSEGRRMAVTYSPIGHGEFKFWRVQAEDKDTIRVEDHLAGLELVPRPPRGNDVWTLADFIVKGTSARGYQMGIDMWVLWKNNMAYRVQYLSFMMPSIPQEHSELRNLWQNGWATVIAENSNSTAPECGPCDATGVPEKWLREVFAPGRFPTPTIEAALSAYERAIGKTGDTTGHRKGLSLAESICTAIASTSALTKSPTGDIDHDQFRTSSETQWRRFYRILIELDKPRGEALSLAFDSTPSTHPGHPEMPWIVCADRLSTVRQCSDMESICHRPDSHRSALTTLVNTGRSFVDGFSDSMLQVCQSVLRAELFEETTKTDHERIQFFSDKAGFWRQISDEDCALVTDALGQNFNQVTTELYQHLLDRMNEVLSTAPEFSASDFGQRIALKTTLDLANLYWNVCFSQLILLVHMEFEFDQPQDALHNRVDIGYVYRELLRTMKRLEFIRWLANTELHLPVAKVTAGGESLTSSRRGTDDLVATSALELNLSHLMGFSDIEASPSRITDIAVDICAPDSSIELVPELVQCNLLVQNRPDLAADLSPFCSQEPFSTYVQGRVYLATRDFAAAADNFKKAAFCLSAPWKKKGRETHSGGLLDSIEWDQLHAGLPRYYGHIVALFEKQKAYSYVIEFARLALQFINGSTRDADTIRADMQSRLFGGATQLSDFETAHATLVTMRNRRLQHGCLHKLVTTMCDNMHSSELARLLFPGLESDVDEILESKCHDTVDVVTGIPYHQILYAWRIKANNYRGAAAVLFDRIHKLRELGEGDVPLPSNSGGGEDGEGDVLDTAVTRQYLMLINVLSCVEPKQAWITTSVPSPNRTANSEQADLNGTGGGGGNANKKVKRGEHASSSSQRRVVTLADIRKEYQDELDRIAAIQNNQFGFEAGDEMEIL